ncbi:hypothetical protein PCL_01182 [Purpureocillium lilacinum]|uniref:Acetylxylan esterase n=1 Tax=Purpureocillium lilacinum TaxID=33203 RepID=A0A2U3E4U0_PURLI|nr:hypothetical protein PCL_01182 [Purpureocillium lilacinum]
MRAASSLAALALLAGAASAAPSISGRNATTCATGLYIVVARGTTEPQGAGVTGLLAGNITAKIPGSKVEALVYPATFSDPAYQDSVADGVKGMQSVVNNYLDACPDGKMAIMGYSQGAHVGMDAVCGGSGGVFDAARALPTADIKKNVIAMVFFGDPTHVANLTYDKGTSIKNGLFERSNSSVDTCKQYSDRLVSYCDTGDVYCDVGKDKKVHGGYVEKYGDDVIKYVVDKYHAAIMGTNSTTTTATSSATGTATVAPTGSGSATATTTGGASATGTGTGTGTGAASPTKTAGAAGLSAGKGLYMAPLVVGVAAPDSSAIDASPFALLFCGITMDGPDSHPQWRRLSGSVGETSFDPPWVITGTHLIGNTNVRLPSDLQCGGPSSQLPNPLVVQQQLAGASSRRPLPLSYTRACRFASGKLRLPAGLTHSRAAINPMANELAATSRGLDESPRQRSPHHHDETLTTHDSRLTNEPAERCSGCKLKSRNTRRPIYREPRKARQTQSGPNIRPLRPASRIA